MKTISEKEIQSIIVKTPGFTREQVVEGLKKKGYGIESEAVSVSSSKGSAPMSAMDVIRAGIGKAKDEAISSGAGSVFLGPVFGAAMQPLVRKAVSMPEVRQAAAEVPKMVAGSTAQLVAKPFVSLRAGLTGDYAPVEVPVAGSVRPYENPLSPASQYIAQGAGKKASPEEVAAARKIGLSNLGEAAGTVAGAALETATLGAGGSLKRPLTRVAERLYQSALKPSAEAIEQGVVKTGLAERVWLTKGGVEKAASKIDELEGALGKVIDAAKEQGLKVPTSGLREFVDPIRKWYETVDVAGSKAAQKYIDDTLKGFTKKYGANVPIEKAQELKVNTMRLLRNSYGELSNVQKETQKQVARFLKEGIVEKAPAVGDINARLKNLYALDQSLESASRRIGNLNLLGLGGKIGAAAGGKMGAALGLVADVLDKAAVKSGVAIGVNELAKLAGPGSTIPATVLLNYVLGKTKPRAGSGE